jgi:DNA-binding transcriptional ArsR family regulator
MNAVIRKKIQDRLVKAKAQQAGAEAQSQSKLELIVKQILVEGEVPLTIKEVTVVSGYSHTTVSRHLKGRPGWLRSKDGGIRIARSLVRTYLQEQAARGAAEAAQPQR